ncbi:hypothetical protein C7I55_12645 [Sphingomonas deserti]|uniref:Uncharacterized protein n=2 Tax=Allosphingosinicella deserti TaxID=2116704 RepID=A0A2P7QNA4_9SPHN|nr:hypothetical protein C7I55_12645 [Sphingomonas deserti]
MEAKMTKDKRRKTKPAAQEPLINAFAAQHGTYRETTVVDLSGELGGGRQKMTKVLRNLYPNVADRWLAEGGAGFDDPQRHAIEHCRALWASIGGQGKLVSSWSQTGGGGKHCRAQLRYARHLLCWRGRCEDEPEGHAHAGSKGGHADAGRATARQASEGEDLRTSGLPEGSEGMSELRRLRVAEGVRQGWSHSPKLMRFTACCGVQDIPHIPQHAPPQPPRGYRKWLARTNGPTFPHPPRRAGAPS